MLYHQLCCFSFAVAEGIVIHVKEIQVGRAVRKKNKQQFPALLFPILSRILFHSSFSFMAKAFLNTFVGNSGVFELIDKEKEAKETEKRMGRKNSKQSRKT